MFVDYFCLTMTREEFLTLNWINAKCFPNSHTLLFFFSGLSYWCCYSNSIYKKNILSLETNAINNRKEYGDRTVVASLRLSYIEIISKGVMITTTEVFGFAPCINDN